MPAKPTTPARRPSTGQSKRIEDYMAAMPRYQRVIVFFLGLALTLWGMTGVHPEHWAEPGHNIGVTIAEIGWSTARISIGIMVMIPPLGMWFIRNVPLPKWLKRKEDG